MAVPQRDRIGPYELLLLLARGGMAELYLGRLRGYAGADRLVAVKVILPHLASDKTFTEMFINEGRIAARLSHPNICHVTELRKDGDDLALAMEYLEGVGWDALVAAAPRDPRLVAGVLAQACEGLHHAHTLQELDGTPIPVVHRDVSPQNLFVTTAGTVKVLDFGVSKIASDRNRTRTGVLKGKLPYMAPEQIEGTAVDARADIWALGVILWEALTGRRLFDRDSDFQIWKAITEQPIPPIGDPALDRVIARALARDREQRYPTALELARDLEAAAGGAYRHAEIADTVRTRCSDALAELKRKIEVAAKGREEPAPEASLGDSRASAETVSMLMRKDSVMVAHPRRRWWPVALGALALATVAVIAVAMRSGDAAGPSVAAPSISGSATPRDTHAGTSGEPHDATTTRGTPGTTPGTTTAAGTTTAGRTTTADGTTTAGRTATAGGTTTGARTTSGTTTTARGTATTARGSASRDPNHAMAPGATGTFAVDSTPYATIYIDGTLIGDTPLDRVALPVGTHTVKAVLADGRHKSFAIEIAADRKTTSGMLSW